MLRIERRGLFAMGIFSLLSAWLAPAKAKTPSFADVSEFREFVMAAFKRQFGVDSVVPDPDDPAQFKVVMGERSSTSNVTNMFGYLRAYPNEDTEKIVSRYINSIIQSRTRTVDDSNIVAVIRDRNYVDYTSGMGVDVLHERLVADLIILYMSDQPDSISPITAQDFPGRELASVRKVALNNVRQWLPKIVSDDELGSAILYYVEDNTMLSPSLIIIDEFWKSIEHRFPGDVLIAIPRKDQLFILDDDGKSTTRAHARRLIEVTIEEDFNVLSPVLYARRNGKIVAVPD